MGQHGRWYRSVAVGAAVAMVAACGPIEDDQSSEATTEEAAAEGETTSAQASEPAGEPQTGGDLVVGLEAESTGYSPWGDSYPPATLNVGRAVFDPLLERDEDGIPQPYLAEAIEVNDEFTEYTLTLREGVVFHDGEPLDADAVVRNFDEHLTAGSRTAAQVAPIEEVVADDELTVRFVLDQPHVAFPDTLTGYVGYVISPAAIEAGTVSEEPVGTGPFEFVSWQRDQQLELTRNDDYWQEGLPYLDSLTFRPIPDEDARLQSLLSGDIDVMQSLRQSTIARARDEGNLNLFEHIGNDAGATILNTAVPPFDDLRVREAWAYSLDQDELIAVLGGTGISPVAQGVFNPDSPWYDESVTEVWPTEDLDRAQAALDDYVEDPERSDGEEPGTPVSFVFGTQPDPSLLETSSVYQAQVARIGLEMQIETVEQAVHVQEATGEAPDFIGDYQAKIFRIGQSVDPDWLVSYFAPGSPLNFTNFVSEELLGTLIQARQTPDRDARRELYAEANRIFAEQLPFTQTGYTATVLAATGDVWGLDDWELPGGEPGIGHPESVGRWAHVWREG